MLELELRNLLVSRFLRLKEEREADGEADGETGDDGTGEAEEVGVLERAGGGDGTNCLFRTSPLLRISSMASLESSTRACTC